VPGSTPASLLVAAEGVTKRFGDRTAVDGLSLTIGRGEIVALLGPNGAGKTTTLRLLAGLLLPDAGAISVDGLPLTRASAPAIRARIGLLTEAPGLWDRLPVRFTLTTYARLHGVAHPERRVDELLAAFDLAERGDDPAATYSKGMKQRAAIARALLHDPPVVLLDEPTSGLDPAAAKQVRDAVAALRARGCGVLVSTHNLAEADALADRIAVLRTRLLALDTPAVLRRGRGRRVTVDLDGEAAPWVDVAAAGGGAVGSLGPRLTVALAEGEHTADLVARLVAAGARVTGVAPEGDTLEQAYLALVDADA
jgi:ABC-2 type transport system ATP-binding protein